MGIKFYVTKAYEFNKYNIFSNYVQHFYSLKSSATGPVREIAKLLLNSLYGRFGISPFIEETIICPSPKSYGNKIVTNIALIVDNI